MPVFCETNLTNSSMGYPFLFRWIVDAARQL
jgi:hypothetical protein